MVRCRYRTMCIPLRAPMFKSYILQAPDHHDTPLKRMGAGGALACKTPRNGVSRRLLPSDVQNMVKKAAEVKFDFSTLERLYWEKSSGFLFSERAETKSSIEVASCERLWRFSFFSPQPARSLYFLSLSAPETRFLFFFIYERGRNAFSESN